MKNFNQINVENLFNKVEKFYKTFYINKLIKGVITTFGLILGLFLTFNVVFYYASIPNWLRYGLFYGFVISLFCSLYYWVLIPSSKLFKLRAGLTSIDAANYIGEYFSEIGDKLVNTLQLHSTSELTELTVAALNQNSQLFQGYQFEKAAPTFDSDKRIWLAVIPVLLLATIWFGNSNLITKGSERFVNYETDYSLIAPFDFSFSKNISVKEGDDISISVKLQGEDIPSELWIDLSGNKYKMVSDKGTFSYTLKNVTSGFVFLFTDGKFSSKSGSLSVIKKPIIDDIQIEIVFPDYLNKNSQMISNPTYLEVPVGSSLKVHGNGEFFDSYKMLFNDHVVADGLERTVNSNLVLEEDGVLNVVLFDSELEVYDGYTCDVRVLLDEYPTIKVEEVDFEGTGFVGSVTDDYGITKLNVRIKNNEKVTVKSVPISLTDGVGNFSYQIDDSEFENEVSIQFVVYDNDAANGFKSSKSGLFLVGVKTAREEEEELGEQAEELKKEFEKVLERSRKLEDEMKSVNSDLMNKKELSWSDEQKVRNISEEGKNLQKELENLEKQVKELNKEVNKQDKVSQEVLDKQLQIEDLLDKLLDEESKNLLEELQKMLDELDKEALQGQLQELEKNQEDLNTELDRDLEILKQMEVERQFDLNKDKLDSLHKKLNSEIEKDYDKKDLEEQFANQKDLEKEFSELQEDLKKMDSLNKELDDPNDLGLDEEKMDDVAKDMKESSDAMEQSDSKEGEKKQSEAEKKMEEMLEKMENSSSMGGGSQQGEDLEALRRILENLLVLSFDQEGNMMEVKSVNDSDPRFVELTKEQLQLLDNSKLIRDSLNSLSVRVPQIKSTISKEVKAIEDNMDLSVDNLKERRKPQAGLHQQKSLTAINNLAVLLDEIIRQMQEQQKNKNKGDGSCSKPGQGNPKSSIGNSKKKQAELAKQIEKMKKGLEKGQKPGKMNPGQIGAGKSGEIAKLAAQQEQIRNEIRKMRDELQKEGNIQGAGSLKALEEMLDKNEEDLINLELDNEFFARQKEIEVKMLEAESASREREKEKKRESQVANLKQENRDQLLEDYLKEKERELEILRLRKVRFSGYYKKQVEILDEQ